MELAHQDKVLAAFLEPGSLPDVAKRANMSLAALAAWTNKNLDLLEGVHKALVTRCKLIAAHIELSALSALSTVSSTVTSSDDPKLRERALERQRKAANAILRHRTWVERIPRASVGPHAPANTRAPDHSTPSNAHRRMPNAGSSPAPMPSSTRPPSPRSAGRSTRSEAKGDEGTCSATDAPKPSLAARLAARRLAALQAS